MKYLLLILLSFYGHSYSKEFNEKELICIDENRYKKNVSNSDQIFGYIFKYNSVNYYYIKMDRGKYEINNILNIKYNIDENFILIDLEYGSLLINRKTLEHSVNNNITAKCELAKNQNFFFDLLNERKNQLNYEFNTNR